MNNATPHILFVMSGPSGVGKGTVADLLKARNADIAESVSATTRAPREGEVHGQQYFFITVDEFKRGIMEKTYNYDAYVKRMEEYSSFYKDQCSDNEMLYYYLGKNTFGYGFEPFELSQELMNKIKASGVKYIEE